MRMAEKKCSSDTKNLHLFNINATLVCDMQTFAFSIQVMNNESVDAGLSSLNVMNKAYSYAEV